jgi:hypothetical protein
VQETNIDEPHCTTFDCRVRGYGSAGPANSVLRLRGFAWRIPSNRIKIGMTVYQNIPSPSDHATVMMGSIGNKPGEKEKILEDVCQDSPRGAGIFVSDRTNENKAISEDRARYERNTTVNAW